MKRKYLLILLTLILSISLVACGSDDAEVEEPIEEVEEEEEMEIEEEQEEVEIEKEEPVEEEQEEVEIEEEGNIENNELFNEMYYNIADRTLAHGKDAILMKAKAKDFSIEEDEDMNSLIISDKNNDEKYKNDYVYIRFDSEREGNTVSIASYYHEKEHIQVSFTNYSTDGELQYDSLNKQIIGNSEEKADSIEEQIKFLNTAKAK